METRRRQFAMRRAQSLDRQRAQVQIRQQEEEQELEVELAKKIQKFYFIKFQPMLQRHIGNGQQQRQFGWFKLDGIDISEWAKRAIVIVFFGINK